MLRASLKTVGILASPFTRFIHRMVDKLSPYIGHFLCFIRNKLLYSQKEWLIYNQIVGNQLKLHA
jgi:hypothetical protein